jgi:hypothetical protein
MAEYDQGITRLGELLQWIYFLSSITDHAEIKNTPGIAESRVEEKSWARWLQVVQS